MFKIQKEREKGVIKRSTLLENLQEKGFSGLYNDPLTVFFCQNIKNDILIYGVNDCIQIKDSNIIPVIPSKYHTIVNLQVNEILIIRLIQGIIIVLNSEVMMDVSYDYKRVQRASTREE